MSLSLEGFNGGSYYTIAVVEASYQPDKLQLKTRKWIESQLVTRNTKYEALMTASERDVSLCFDLNIPTAKLRVSGIRLGTRNGYPHSQTQSMGTTILGLEMDIPTAKLRVRGSKFGIRNGYPDNQSQGKGQ